MMKYNLNKKTKQHIRFFLIFLGMILLFSYIVFSNHASAGQAPITLKHTPTILVPGSSATNNRFDDFIKEMKSAGIQNQSVLKVYVKSDGTIELDGKLQADDEAPFIVVGFSDNEENDVPKEAEMFQKVLTTVKQYYHFTHYNYIGHSNGGLVITDYLKHFAKTDDPTLQKLVTIGTPYDGTEDTSASESMINAAILSEQTFKTQTDFKMLNIAGNTGDDSDNIVPVDSVLASKKIYEKYVLDYQDIVIIDKKANHSDLVENPIALTQIKDFIFSS